MKYNLLNNNSKKEIASLKIQISELTDLKQKLEDQLASAEKDGLEKIEEREREFVEQRD